MTTRGGRYYYYCIVEKTEMQKSNSMTKIISLVSGTGSFCFFFKWPLMSPLGFTVILFMPSTRNEVICYFCHPQGKT